MNKCFSSLLPPFRSSVELFFVDSFVFLTDEEDMEAFFLRAAEVNMLKLVMIT